jgi:DNA repair exonuclease SbcCD ATPase subunit
VSQTWIQEAVNLRQKINEDKAALRYHVQRLADTERKIKLEERHEVILKKCRVILHASALKIQKEVKEYLDNLVSMALKSVLEDPYQFEAIFETKHNETECRLIFKRDGDERDPMDSTGGGAVDVAAFALRVAMQRMICNRSSILLDEPFRNVSADRHPFVVDLLETVSKKLSLQLIMITHRKRLTDRADKVITIKGGEVVKTETPDGQALIPSHQASPVAQNALN